jgi:hypothetical protein
MQRSKTNAWRIRAMRQNLARLSPRVRDLPRLMLVGTGLTSLLGAVGAYLLLVHWPSPAEKQ